MVWLLLATVVVLVALVYLLGFRLGADTSRQDLVDVHLEGRRAERELNELTRQAFIAMSEHTLHHGEGRTRKRRPDDGS